MFCLSNSSCHAQKGSCYGPKTSYTFAVLKFCMELHSLNHLFSWVYHSWCNGTTTRRYKLRCHVPFNNHGRCGPCLVCIAGHTCPSVRPQLVGLGWSLIYYFADRTAGYFPAHAWPYKGCPSDSVSAFCVYIVEVMRAKPSFHRTCVKSRAGQ